MNPITLSQRIMFLNECQLYDYNKVNLFNVNVTTLLWIQLSFLFFNVTARHTVCTVYHYQIKHT